MSNLIFSKVLKVNSRKYRVNQFQFKNATDCTAHYNELVKKYAQEELTMSLSYNLNDWTSNNFINNNKPLNISRFGDVIQLIESKQIIELDILKQDFSIIYREIKRLKST